MLVVVTERSGDRKLTRNENVSSTWVPQVSCHSDCPLKNNGCYAELGRAALHTSRLNRQAKATRQTEAALRKRLAKEEAKGIRGLTGERKLRVHVVGDCATAESAGLIGKAMVDHQKKQGKAAWTYTHSWRRFGPKAWKGANVLASCEKPAQVKQARAKGYATALIVPGHATNKVYQYKGINVLPCPAQFKRTADGKIEPAHRIDEGETRLMTCEECNICQNPAMLKAKKLSVGFQPDGVSTKKVLAIIGAGQ